MFLLITTIIYTLVKFAFSANIRSYQGPTVPSDLTWRALSLRTTLGTVDKIFSIEM